jgi:uncharacterized cupin superfamily protein
MAYPNVYEAKFDYDDSDPAGFANGIAYVGKLAGGTENSVRLFELPPGVKLSPYHYEYVEEWLLVVEGSADVRGPGGSETLPAGSLMCFPRGPAGAHQVACHGEQSARVLMWSSAQEPAVAVYPDSDKIGVWPGNPDDDVMVRRADGHINYFDGESGG